MALSFRCSRRENCRRDSQRTALDIIDTESGYVISFNQTTHLHRLLAEQ